MGGIGSGRNKIKNVNTKKDAFISFRLELHKKDFLNRVYAEKLPDIFRSMADELIIKAVTENEFKLKKV